MSGGTELWRQVGDAISASIAAGELSPGERLPASGRLAERFGVHQHTVLKAIARLQDEGLLRVEQGRGTFVVENSIAFRLGKRTWFEQNLSERSHLPSRRVLSVERIAPEGEVSRALADSAGTEVARAEMIGEADGVPVYLGRHHFSELRLPGISNVLADLKERKTRQIIFSKLFAPYGITEFRRAEARIRGRMPTPDEASLLEVSPKVPLLETFITLVDKDDRPLVFGISAYCADRVELTLDI